VVPVEPGSSYTITGARSPNGPVDANFSFGSVERWNTIQNIGLNQLRVGPDGSYVITLDATPAYGRPNHIQRNALGRFRLAVDEALIVTLQPGASRYSTIPVTNIWGVTPEYWRHTSSLNNRQATSNPDGSFTVVISNWDPAVANWVDTSGLEEGIIMLRWQILSNDTGRTPEPAVRAVLVKQKDLAAALPPEMAVYNRRQRETQLKDREAGFARRFANR
jgi:hypothetical protein